LGRLSRHPALHLRLRCLSWWQPRLLVFQTPTHGFSVSAEAEYRAIANGVAEASWLRQLLQELHHSLVSACHVYYDNVSVVYLSTNPVHHQRTKHVEIDLHFVRERVAIGVVRVLHVPTTSQFADVFTKGLPSSVFMDFRSSLNVCSTDILTAGGC
jgi:hypothetical protein